MRDPAPRSRRVFAFHRPEILYKWLTEECSLRARLTGLPALDPNRLPACQTDAITQLEQSLGRADPRALIQMARGAGKTFTACSFSWRLLKDARARRILFLVDPANLGTQTLKEFLGEPLDEADEERSGFETWEADGGTIRPVAYNPKLPIETFDFIITDECHHSIYGVCRQVLDYFDASIIGLTATPTKHTPGFFNQNLGDACVKGEKIVYDPQSSNALFHSNGSSAGSLAITVSGHEFLSLTPRKRADGSRGERKRHMPDDSDLLSAVIALRDLPQPPQVILVKDGLGGMVVVSGG